MGAWRRYVLHDSDSIFSAEVDAALKGFGLRVLKTPVTALGFGPWISGTDSGNAAGEWPSPSITAGLPYCKNAVAWRFTSRISSGEGSRLTALNNSGPQGSPGVPRSVHLAVKRFINISQLEMIRGSFLHVRSEWRC